MEALALPSEGSGEGVTRLVKVGGTVEVRGSQRHWMGGAARGNSVTYVCSKVGIACIVGAVASMSMSLLRCHPWHQLAWIQTAFGRHATLAPARQTKLTRGDSDDMGGAVAARPSRVGKPDHGGRHSALTLSSFGETLTIEWRSISAQYGVPGLDMLYVGGITF